VVREIVKHIEGRKSTQASYDLVTLGSSTGILIILPYRVPSELLPEVAEGISGGITSLMQVLGQLPQEGRPPRPAGDSLDPTQN
jgi:hypothetical protein